MGNIIDKDNRKNSKFSKFREFSQNLNNIFYTKPCGLHSIQELRCDYINFDTKKVCQRLISKVNSKKCLLHSDEENEYNQTQNRLEIQRTEIKQNSNKISELEENNRIQEQVIQKQKKIIKKLTNKQKNLEWGFDILKSRLDEIDSNNSLLVTRFDNISDSLSITEDILTMSKIESKPNEDSADPNEDSADPNEDSAKPNVDSTEPNVDLSDSEFSDYEIIDMPEDIE